MKIIIPILSFGKAGGYRVLSKMATELVRLGNEVIFLCPDGSDNPYFPTDAKIYWINKKGNTYEDYSHQPAQAENFFSIQQKITKALAKIKTSHHGFDVILANHSLTTLPIRYNKLFKKTVYYVQAYEPEMYQVMGGYKNQILKWLSISSYSSKIFTIVNADIYKNYKSLQSTQVLHPGLDLNIFYPSIANARKDKNIIIGTVGRLERFKGTNFVFEAFKKIKLNYPKALLHVAYGRPEDFGNQEGVVCFDPKNDTELSEFYRGLNFYICGGYIQLGAFHYPIAESMACGIPVITTPYYPANEQNAWIVESKNVNDIVQKFYEAISSSEEVDLKRVIGIKDVQKLSWKEKGLQLQFILKQFLQQ